MRFKNGPQLPGAGRTRAGHHHGSHTPTSPGAILLGKMAYHTKQIRRECTMAIVQMPETDDGSITLFVDDFSHPPNTLPFHPKSQMDQEGN